MTQRRSARLLLPVLLGWSLMGGSLAISLGGCGSKAPKAPPVAAQRRVSALGRIEPETKIRKVSVSSSLSGDRIEQILVEENQLVKADAPLARLNSYGTLEASLAEANENVAVAQSKLAQVQAGAKQGEIRAQEYKIQSLERQLAAEKHSQDHALSTARANAN